MEKFDTVQFGCDSNLHKYSIMAQKKDFYVTNASSASLFATIIPVKLWHKFSFFLRKIPSTSWTVYFQMYEKMPQK